MPELPEVETVVRALRPRLVGRKVAGAQVVNPVVCPVAPRRLRGAVLEEVARRGKYILFRLARGRSRPVLVFHLGMTGQLLLVPPAEPQDKHLHLILRFAGLAEELRFRDVRKLGGVCLYPSWNHLQEDLLERLGPEAHTLTTRELTRVARAGSRPVKPLLMDQSKIAGLGNIYTDEALWRARIHPLRPSNSLSADELRNLARAVRTVLRRAIRERGSSVNDFLTPEGSPGRYQRRHAVYGRAGEPCPRCGEPVVRITVQGRGTHFCPRCQRVPGCGGADAD